jgi:hypothetical protein
MRSTQFIAALVALLALFVVGSTFSAWAYSIADVQTIAAEQSDRVSSGDCSNDLRDCMADMDNGCTAGVTCIPGILPAADATTVATGSRLDLASQHLADGRRPRLTLIHLKSETLAVVRRRRDASGSTPVKS